MLSRTSTAPHNGILRLTWPIFVELLLQLLVGIIAQLLLAKYSEASVVSVGNANQILNTVILLFSIVGTSATILISQYIGAGKREILPSFYTISLLGNLLFGLVVSGLLIGLAPQIFTWMRVPEHTILESISYLRITGGTLFLQALFVTLTAIFRSNALVRESMIASMMVHVMSVAGSAIAVYGLGPIPPSGVDGVALSIVLGRLMSVIFLVVLLFTRIGWRFSIKHLVPLPVDLIKGIFRIGIPSGAETFFYNIAQILLLVFINTFGQASAATRMYALNIVTLSYLFSSSIAQAAQILIGRDVGAKKLDQANKRMWSTVWISLSCNVAISVIIFLLSDQIFGLFSNEPQVLAFGKIILGIDIVVEVGRGFNLVLVRSLQASGEVRYPLWVCMVCVWLFEVALGYVLGVWMGFGLAGIWAGMAIDECVRSILYIRRWRKGYWRQRNLIGAGIPPSIEA